MAPRFLHREHVLVTTVSARSSSLIADTSIGIGKKRVARNRLCRVGGWREEREQGEKGSLKGAR